MSAIDPFRQLVKEWDINTETIESQVATISKLQQERDALLAQVAILEEEVERLEEELAGTEPVPTLFEDDFAEIPVEDPLGHHVDAPDAAFTLIPGGLQVALRPGQLNKQGKSKAEFGPRFNESAQRYGRIPFGAERWHGITVTIPDGWQRDGSKSSIIDFHGTEDEPEKGIGRNANLSAFIVGDDWVGWRLWSDNAIQTENEHRIETFRFPYHRGMPIRFIFHTIFDWHADGVGLTEIWGVAPDGVPKVLFQERGPNAYNDAEGCYWKTGLYYPAANSPNPWPPGITPKTMVFSRLKIMGPGATLEMML